MRRLCISDIHGNLTMFKRLLLQVRPTKDDQLILLGDYIDRGPHSRQVIETVMKLRDEGAIVLMGNHEQMMLDSLKHGDAFLWNRNGGLETLSSYCEGFAKREKSSEEALNSIQESYSSHVDFIAGLPFMHEDEHFIFVHAGINGFMFEKWREQPVDDYLWAREESYYMPSFAGKIVVFGHTPTKYIKGRGEKGGEHEIWVDRDKHFRRIGIDCGATYPGGNLACLEINDQGMIGHYMNLNGAYYSKSLGENMF